MSTRHIGIRIKSTFADRLFRGKMRMSSEFYLNMYTDMHNAMITILNPIGIYMYHEFGVLFNVIIENEQLLRKQ